MSMSDSASYKSSGIYTFPASLDRVTSENLSSKRGFELCRQIAGFDWVLWTDALSDWINAHICNNIADQACRCG